MCDVSTIIERSGISTEEYLKRSYKSSTIKSLCCKCLYEKKKLGMSEIGRIIGLNHSTIHYKVNHINGKLKYPSIKLLEIMNNHKCYSLGEKIIIKQNAEKKISAEQRLEIVESELDNIYILNPKYEEFLRERNVLLRRISSQRNA